MTCVWLGLTLLPYSTLSIYPTGTRNLIFLSPLECNWLGHYKNVFYKRYKVTMWLRQTNKLCVQWVWSAGPSVSSNGTEVANVYQGNRTHKQTCTSPAVNTWRFQRVFKCHRRKLSTVVTLPTNNLFPLCTMKVSSTHVKHLRDLFIILTVII